MVLIYPAPLLHLLHPHGRPYSSLDVPILGLPLSFSLGFLSFWPRIFLPQYSQSLLHSCLCSNPLLTSSTLSPTASSRWPHQLLNLLCCLGSYLNSSTNKCISIIYFLISWIPPLEFKLRVGSIFTCYVHMIQGSEQPLTYYLINTCLITIDNAFLGVGKIQ